jgi:hypothetical protein
MALFFLQKKILINCFVLHVNLIHTGSRHISFGEGPAKPSKQEKQAPAGCSVGKQVDSHVEKVHTAFSVMMLIYNFIPPTHVSWIIASRNYRMAV